MGKQLQGQREQQHRTAVFFPGIWKAGKKEITFASSPLSLFFFGRPPLAFAAAAAAPGTAIARKPIFFPPLPSVRLLGLCVLSLLDFHQTYADFLFQWVF